MDFLELIDVHKLCTHSRSEKSLICIIIDVYRVNSPVTQAPITRTKMRALDWLNITIGRVLRGATQPIEYVVFVT